MDDPQHLRKEICDASASDNDHVLGRMNGNIRILKEQQRLVRFCRKADPVFRLKDKITVRDIDLPVTPHGTDQYLYMF